MPNVPGSSAPRPPFFFAKNISTPLSAIEYKFLMCRLLWRNFIIYKSYSSRGIQLSGTASTSSATGPFPKKTSAIEPFPKQLLCCIQVLSERKWKKFGAIHIWIFRHFKILSPKRRNMGNRQALYEWVGSITTCGPPYKVDKEVFSRQFPTYVLCIRTKKKQRTVADFFARKSWI